MKRLRWKLIDVLSIVQTGLLPTILAIVAYQATVGLNARLGNTLPLLSRVGLFVGYVLLGLILVVLFIGLMFGSIALVATTIRWLARGVRRRR